jgi:hypothetical protein
MNKKTSSSTNYLSSYDYNEIEKFNLFEKSNKKFSNNLEIAFIGNSITKHSPSDELGWLNDNGMAASSWDKDYCHILMSLLKIPKVNSYVGNFAELERTDIEGSLIETQLEALLTVNKPKILVVQLGDNITNIDQLMSFKKNLEFIGSISKKNCEKVLMISTWWESKPKDEVIQTVCEKHIAEFIYIGHLFNAPTNLDRLSKQYIHAGVDNHPRDWGMSQIANIMYATILGKSNPQY